MNHYLIYEKITGKPLRTVFCSVSPPLLDGEGLIKGVDNYEGYVLNDQLMQKPKKPSDFHDWDWKAKDWVPNVYAATAFKLQMLQHERNQRFFAPCRGFDANQISRERMSGMITRIQRGDGLPTGWIGWRDTNNQMQWGNDDAKTVLANLTVLVRAIEEREQALLIAYWTHEANIKTLTNIKDILNYDVTTGWHGKQTNA